MKTLKLKLTDAQYAQLINSLENDWADNSAINCKVIDNILDKIKAQTV